MENNKPMNLIREDFITNVVMLINESNLPLFVVEDTLRMLLANVSDLARKQLEQDRQMYALMNRPEESAPIEDETQE